MNNFLKRSVTGVFLLLISILPLLYWPISAYVIVDIIYVLVFFEWMQITKSAKHIVNNIYLWRTIGIAYLVLSFLGVTLNMTNVSYNLFTMNNSGYALLSIFMVVWVTDAGAYIFGNLLKGPKIAPSISRNKTWSGCIFGVVLPVMMVIIIRNFVNIDITTKHIALTFAFALITELGDFIESWTKRIFKIKDSGDILPGHGGFIDRYDGFIAVGLLLFIFYNLGVLNGGN